MEEGETPDKKEKPKLKEKKKKPKVPKDDEEREEGEEVDDEEEEEEKDAGSASGTSPSKKAEGKTDSGVHITIKQDSDARAVSEESRKHTPRSISGRPYIRLTCPHCYVRCITFKVSKLFINSGLYQH